MQCVKCNTDNRETAKFCKNCGGKMDTQAASAPGQVLPGVGGSIDDLVGLDELKKELAALQAILEGKKLNNIKESEPYDTIIIGSSGTAKTLICNLIAGLFFKFGMITKGKPETKDAGELEGMAPNDLKNLFNGAKGGIVFIDNAQKLVDNEGKPMEIFSKIINIMDTINGDPIVLMAGLPSGLKEFVKSSESANKQITNRFEKIFIIPDYTPDQYVAICENELKKQGFSFSSEFSQKLLQRFRFLYKELKKPDSKVRAVNGYLALKEAQTITGSYFMRKATDKTILPEDIKDKVEEKKNIQEILAEIDSFIGMTELKQEIRNLYDQLHRIAEEEKQGIKRKKPALHIVITGNPGTGKTTVARQLGKIFEGLGLLDSGHVIETDRSKLVGQYTGSTAPLTNDVCDSAMGGILFIDEVYTLAKGGGNDFGQECIDTLLKRMEDDRGKFMVVVAGYKNLMDQFLKANDGLKSRFTTYFHIEDYNPDELADIFGIIAKEEQLALPPETREKVVAFFKERCARKTRDFANGREARNLFGEAMNKRTKRLKQTEERGGSQDSSVLSPEDIPETAADKMVSIEEALKDLNELTGLKSVKDAIVKIANSLQAQKLTGETETLSKHFIFMGNPGTGKTTVARIMGDVFKAVGLLPTNNLIEVDRSKLIATYQGETPKLVAEQCDNAMGGILFIDEAYALKQGPQDSYGQEAVNTLLKRMEDDRGKFVVIAAGYTKEMEEFLASNSGFKSRFSDYINFDDYNVSEMSDIFAGMCKKKNIEFAPGFDEALQKKLTKIYAERDAQFANARTVRQLFDKTRENVSGRVLAMQKPQEELKREILIMRPEDIMEKATEQKTIEEVMAELDSVIGMTEIKKEIKSLYKELSQIAEMEKRGLKIDKPAHHIVLTGNPGTGKTTVARFLGDIFKGLGLLSSNKVVEVDRSKLVGQFVGATAPQTNEVCNSAMGGILFIDEAYSLTQGSGGGNDFGQECIDTLLKRMEDDRGKFVVVAAGYKGPMEKFLTANEGLKSRFTKYFNLEDYNPDELAAIFISLAKKQQYIIPEETKERVVAFFKDRCARKTKDFANGREARNLLTEARKAQSERLSSMDIAKLSNEEILSFLPEDIPVTTSEKTVSIEEALKDLNELTGLGSVKEAVEKIANSLETQKLTGKMEPLKKHFVFTGNPGTGKTTVARIMGEVFKAVGMLPTNNLVEVDRSKLIAAYQGETPKLVASHCDDAMGGILFIDEAYALKQGPQDMYGQEAVDTLLKRMEDDRGKFIVIAAGYSKEMDDFLASNSGFKSRFTDFINFEDYAPFELYEIFDRMCKKGKFTFAPGFEESLKKRLEEMYAKRTESFANARTVRLLYDKTCENVSSRVMNMKKSGASDDDLRREVLIMHSEDLDTTVS